MGCNKCEGGNGQPRKGMHHTSQVCSSVKGGGETIFCNFFCKFHFFRWGMRLKINSSVAFMLLAFLSHLVLGINYFCKKINTGTVPVG